MYEPYPHTIKKFKIFLLFSLPLLFGMGILWHVGQPVAFEFQDSFISNLNSLKYIVFVTLFLFFLKTHLLLVSKDYLFLLAGIAVSLTVHFSHFFIFPSFYKNLSITFFSLEIELVSSLFFFLFFAGAAFNSGSIIAPHSRKKIDLIVVLLWFMSVLIIYASFFLFVIPEFIFSALQIRFLNFVEIMSMIILLISGIQYIKLYRRTRFDIYFWFLLTIIFFFASYGYLFFSRIRFDFWHQAYEILSCVGFLTLMWIPFLEHTRFMESEVKLRKSLEKSLFQSEQNLQDYSNLVNRVDVGICTFDEQGAIIFCNEKMAGMLGYSVNRLKGRSQKDLFNAKNLEKFRLELEKWKTGVNSKFEIEMKHRRGNAIPVMMSAVPVFDLREKFTGSRIAIFEMSEWKQLEIQLRDESEKLKKMVDKRSADLEKKTDELIQAKTYYETLISGMLDILLVIDKKGNCNFINKYGRDLLGYKASELTHSKLPNFLNDLERFRKNYGDAMKVELHDYEASLKTKDGKEILCSWNVRYLFDANGNHIGAMCVGRDISDYKHLQDNLQKHSQNLERLVADRTEELKARIDQLSKILKIGEEITLNLDQQKILTSICQTIRKLGWRIVVLALKEEKTTACKAAAYAGIGKTKIGQFVKSRDFLFSDPFQFLKDEARISQSYLIRQDNSQASKKFRVNEPWKTNDVLIIPIKIKSRILGFVTLFEPTDKKIPDEQQIQLLEIFVHKAAVAIENRRLFEEIQSRSLELERANKLQSEFFTTMSHELRTPLNSIITLAGVLLRQMSGELNAEQLKQLRIIKQNGDNLLRLINNLLDLSKIEAGRMTLNPTYFSLRQLIQSTLESIQPLCQRKKLKLEMKLDKKLPEYLLNDEDKMQQVFINVLNNAIKFTEKGKITFMAKTAQRGAQILFTISDTGIGMSRAEIDAVFQAYKQLNNSENKNKGGTGLGLSISKQIWQLMGGTISVNSKKGKGTDFHLTLPVQQANGNMETMEALPKSAQKSPQIAPKRTLSKRRNLVLLVDDNQDNQYAAKFILEDRGYRVVFAKDGGEGVQKAVQHAPDLILMDMMMPGMDGYQATRKIRGIKALKNTPIIAMTAKTIQEDKRQAIKAGCNEYLTKPFNWDEMSRKVDKWLKGTK